MQCCNDWIDGDGVREWRVKCTQNRKKEHQTNRLLQTQTYLPQNVKMMWLDCTIWICRIIVLLAAKIIMQADIIRHRHRHRHRPSLVDAGTDALYQVWSVDVSEPEIAPKLSAYQFKCSPRTSQFFYVGTCRTVPGKFFVLSVHSQLSPGIWWPWLPLARIFTLAGRMMCPDRGISSIWYVLPTPWRILHQSM
jgi:hypothetical protein